MTKNSHIRGIRWQPAEYDNAPIYAAVCEEMGLNPCYDPMFYLEELEYRMYLMAGLSVYRPENTFKIINIT